MKITRGGRLAGDLTEDVARLTSSSEHDIYIADEVVEINLAHSLMLAKTGFLGAGEAKALALALKSLLGKVIKIPPQMEDIHMVVEEEVTKKVGPELGGKIHTGKSRNDQVATALRMRLRRFLIEICRQIIALQKAFIQRAAADGFVVMPGFTHMQHAQPVTAAHHLLAYCDMFGRSLDRLVGCYSRVNLSPMGAVALAGTGYAIDRGLVAKYLGFDGVLENSMDSVASRDFALEAVSALSILMVDVSRLSEELIIWCTYEFGYIDLPDDHSSTSSIMPQKKNPVTSEVMRAKSGDVFGELSAMTVIMKGLPLTYNLDMQEVNPHIWRACEYALLSLRVMTDLVYKIRFREQRLREAVTKDFSVATEVADLLVREGGLPFRKAHKAVGTIVRDLVAASTSLSEEEPEHLSEMIYERAGIRIAPDSLKPALDPAENVNIRSTLGGPASIETRRMAAARMRSIASSEDTLDGMELRIQAGKNAMDSTISSFH